MEHNHCLICKHSKLTDMSKFASSYLCKCNSCGFVFSKRIPSEKELSEHYEGYGRQDYLSDVTIKRYEELLDSFESYRKNNKILDVGCGIGYFLEVAKRKGWEVYGTEFTEEAVEICEAKGIHMEQGKLNPDNYQFEFDVITSFEVLEHINNPIEEINNFKSLLCSGGLVYLTTPNFNSLLRYRLGDQYGVITYPEHLCYYTPKTIRYLFKQLGFTQSKIETTGISISRLKNGRNKKASERVGFEKPISVNSSDEKIRQAAETNPFMGMLKSIVNRVLSVLGKGDSLKVHFIKD